MTFEPDYTDCYQLYALGSMRPVVSDDMSVLCSLPSHVDMRGNISPDTTYITLAVAPADWRYNLVCDYFDMTYEDAGIFSHRQIGHMYRVKEA